MSAFGRNMKAWAEKAKAGVDQVTRAAIIDVSTDVIKQTPVDSGRARGNWFASIDNPIQSPILTEKDVTGAMSIARTNAVAAGAPGNKYYLTNNLPYIFRLEYQGWSKQAPQGMVRVSVLRFHAALKKAINEL